jgi:hypothetical protein
VPTQIVAWVPIDLTRVAANIAHAVAPSYRVADALIVIMVVVRKIPQRPPSSGSQALALMLMFDLDRETM